MKRIFRSLAALLIIVISFSAISFAWLASGKYLNFPSSFGGSATPAYFAGGDGSKDNPFRITNPVHLYNLAWLQYLGYFNRREGFNNDRDQTYFALDGNIDMRGTAIPPIGTEEYPFIGEFKGNGHKVTNLTISNKKGTDNLVKTPTNAKFSNDILRFVDDTKSHDIEIVGMFGVTGNYNGYLDTYAPAHSGFTMADVNVSNFYVDKIHVKSNSAKTLAGLAAGYIGGNFSNVGVYRSDIKFAANAQSIDDTTIVSSGVLSQYSLVGAYNEDLVNWSDGAIGFGNSIGIKSLYERIGVFYGNSSESTNVGTVQQPKIYKYYYDESKGSINSQKTGYDSSGFTYYIRGGEVNGSGATYNINGSQLQRPSYLPIKTKSDTDYTVADDNTGYIASGPFDINGGGDIRVRSAKIDSSVHIKYSTNSASNFGDGKNVEILTITKKTYNTDSKLQRITDDYNVGNNEATGVAPQIKGYPKKTQTELGLDAYSEARDEFNKIINGESKWYGFHFMPAAIGINNIYTAPKATINGVTYTNYQMTANSIDFKTKSNGHIAFFAASNYSSNRNFFSLHEIFRKEENPCKINKIREISKIYSVVKDSGGKDYIYLYTAVEGENDTSVSGLTASDLEDIKYTLEFDCAWINNTRTFNDNSLLNNAIYYFEIPVNKGEFALGSAPKDNGAGAYLLYLDIGANGNQTPTGTGYTMDKVRFVNYSGIPSDGNGNVNLSAYKPALITLSGSSTAEEIAVFKRDEQETDGKLKLAYRIINNNANAINVNETTKNMTRKDATLTPSTDGD